MARRLILTANAAAAREFLAQQAAEEEFLAGDLAVSFSAAAFRWAAQAHPLKLPSQAVRLALAWTAAHRAEMGVVAPELPALSAALSELHASGLSPRALKSFGGEGLALATAFEAHRELLSARRLTDPGAVSGLAAQAVREGLPLDFDEVECWPRCELTQGDLELCQALSERVQRVEVQLPFDPARPSLFDPLNPVHQELHRLGGPKIHSTEPGAENALPENVLNSALRGLFLAGVGTPSEAVATFTAGTAEDEAREVALRVRELLGSGVAPDQIAIAAEGEPGPPIFRALRSAGLQVSAAPRGSLFRSPAGRAALALLDLVETGIPRESLCALLGSGLLDLGGSRKSRTPAHFWIRALRESGAAEHRADRLLPPLRTWFDRYQRSHPETARDKELIALERILTRLGELPTEGDLSLHAQALWRALRDLGLDRALGELPPLPFRGEEALPDDQLALFAGTAVRPTVPLPVTFWSRAASLLSLQDLSELLGELVALEQPRSPLPPLDRKSFSELLQAALRGQRARGPRPLEGGLVVTDWSGLAGRQFDHLFLIGLDRRGAEAPDRFLSAALRERVCRAMERPAALAPQDPVSRSARRKLQLLLACGAARSRVTASGARLDAEDRPQEPAPLLEELALVARGGLQRLPFAAGPSPGRCLNRTEAIALDPEAAAARSCAPEEATRWRTLRSETRQRSAAIAAKVAHPFSGAIAAEDLLAQLADRLRFPPEKPFSAKALGLLDGCGFRALADRILHLSDDRDRGDDLDLRDRGELAHRCLESAFRSLADCGLLPLQGGERQSRELEVLLAGVRSALDLYEGEQPIGHPALWRVQRQRLEGQMIRLYAREVAERDEGWVPTDFELRFGQDGRAPLELEVAPGQTIWLGGNLDRVERKGEALRVVDYKTGGVQYYQDRLAGDVELQLPLYALLVGQGSQPVDAVYLSIKDAEVSSSLRELQQKAGIDPDLFLAIDPARRAAARAAEVPNLAERISSAWQRARRGEFAVAPGDCKYCRFAAACRVGPYYQEWDEDV